MALHLVLALCVYLLFTQGAEGNIDETFSSYGNLERTNTYKTKEHCPKGTVPILRQINESERVHLNTKHFYGQHFATIETLLDGSIYRGGEAEISIHDLKLKKNQISKSQIWVENGPPEQVNSIQAGWAVHPRIYGDSVTRITTYWTSDDYHKTGCYNTQCPGFVVISRKFRLGQGFWGTSIYDKSSVTFRMQIFQDGFTGNWALKIFDEVIGYWPKELFTHLNNGASLVRYGGNTFLSPDAISPPMGNGHFPVANVKQTAHFKNVVVIDSNHKRVFVEYKFRHYYDIVSCFGVKYWGYSKANGVSFSFGGPGGLCGI